MVLSLVLPVLVVLVELPATLVKLPGGATNSPPSAGLEQVTPIQIAPASAHLQSLFVVHQPVAPVLGGVHIGSLLPYSQTLVPHAVPPSTQSMSFKHVDWAYADGEVKSTEAAKAAAEKAKALSFTLSPCPRGSAVPEDFRRVPPPGPLQASRKTRAFEETAVGAADPIDAASDA
ncbi:MAG: hypothetical protein ABSC94_03655 [Polyangiaceae bacterium]